MDELEASRHETQATEAAPVQSVTTDVQDASENKTEHSPGGKKLITADQAKEQKLGAEVEARLKECMEGVRKLLYPAIDNRIQQLSLPPNIDSEDFKTYQKLMMQTELGLKARLMDEARELLANKTPEKVAEELVAQASGYLEQLASQFIPPGKIDIHDFDSSPQEKAMLQKYALLARFSTFLGDKINHPESVKNDPELKQKVMVETKGFLLDWAELMAKGKDSNGKFAPGSGENFAQVVREALLNTAGVGHLTKAEFDQLWGEVKSDPKLGATVTELLGTEEKSWKETEKLLDTDDEKLQKVVEGIRKNEVRLQHEVKDNPFGFITRKYSDLGSILIYAGDKILYGAILLNVLFSKGDIGAMLKNPVLLASAGASAAVAYKFHPHMLDGKSEKEKSTDENIQSDFTKLENGSAGDKNVAAWLRCVPKKLLGAASFSEPNVTNLLEEKQKEGKNWISSDELNQVLMGSKIKDFTVPEGSIARESPEAHLLYELLWTAKLHKIDLTKI